MQEQLYSVAIYCRLSTEDRGAVIESSSIQSQKDSLSKYVEEQGWKLFNVYIDDGFSGTTFDRPAFKNMIEDIKKGLINLVITKDLSRLGRNYIQTGYYTEQFFPENNVRYIALNDNYDSLYQQDEFMPFKNIMNEFYAKDISKKIRFAYNSKVARGEINPTQVPFGYYKDGKEVKLDEEAAVVVRLVFEEYIKHGKNAEVCKVLNEKGYLPPSEYLTTKRKTIYGNPSTSKNWTSCSINKIIRNQAYMGTFNAKKTYNISFKDKKRRSNPKDKWVPIEGFYEPIVSKDDWELANRIMDAQIHNPYTLDINKYSGIVRCKHCGAKMHLIKRTRKNDVIFEYMCKNYENNCSGHTVRIFEIDEKVLEGLLAIKEKIFKNKEVFLTNARTYAEKHMNEVKKDDNTALIDSLISRDKALDNLIEKVIEKNVSGLLSSATSDSLLKKYKAEKDDIAAKLKEYQRLENEKTPLKSYEEQAMLLLSVLETIDETTVIDRDLINCLVSKVEILTEPIDGKWNRKFICVEYLGLPEELWEDIDE